MDSLNITSKISRRALNTKLEHLQFIVVGVLMTRVKEVYKNRYKLDACKKAPQEGVSLDFALCNNLALTDTSPLVKNR